MQSLVGSESHATPSKACKDNVFSESNSHGNSPILKLEELGFINNNVGNFEDN